MRNNPKPYEKYKHFKGNLYQIIAIAEDTETQEEQVVYQMLYSPFKIYVRSLQMFMSEVEINKYPDEKQQYRFEQITNIEDITKITPPTDEKSSTPTENISLVEEEYEEVEIEPLLLEFFDATTYVEKLSVLRMLYPKLTNDMINAIAITLDIEVNEGDLDKRYHEVVNCLTTLEKYECSRIR